MALRYSQELHAFIFAWLPNTPPFTESSSTRVDRHHKTKNQNWISRAPPCWLGNRARFVRRRCSAWTQIEFITEAEHYSGSVKGHQHAPSDCHAEWRTRQRNVEARRWKLFLRTLYLCPRGLWRGACGDFPRRRERRARDLACTTGSAPC